MNDPAKFFLKKFVQKGDRKGKKASRGRFFPAGHKRYEKIN